MGKRNVFGSATGQRLLLFSQKWEENYQGERYIILWGFDQKLMKELEDVPLDTIAERLTIYFKDSWYRNCKHSVNAFVKNFNKFIDENPGSDRKQNGRQQTQPLGKSLDEIEYYCEPCKRNHKGNELCPQLASLGNSMNANKGE